MRSRRMWMTAAVFAAAVNMSVAQVISADEEMGTEQLVSADEETRTEQGISDVDETAVLEEKKTENTGSEEIGITLSDEEILVDGSPVSEDSSEAVYAGAEIIYYKEGQDALYGAGDESDGHSEEEAAMHTVLTITQPGTYRVTGSISKGQIAVDLGESSREDETAVVKLILDQADITCTVAPAIVVYNAYECGSDNAETASRDVDTENAGFRLILADGSENTVNGSHVAKIYKEGTTQEEIDAGEAKKAWKFDAAIDSLVSLQIDGEAEGSGRLNLSSDNEGIESALHLTVNSGTIDIQSADDAVNANEDGVSVITINGGTLTCNSGLGKEGDGIDSNGWIVINGGTVSAGANKESQDSGLDSDLGIYINGGTVLGSGNMYDEVSAESGQQFVVLGFAEKLSEDEILLLKGSEGEAAAAFSAVNPSQILVYSSPELTEGDYTLYKVNSVEGTKTGNIYTDISGYEGETQLQYSSTSVMGGPQMGGPRPELPEGAEAGDHPEPPEGAEAGERPEPPEGAEAGDHPEPPEGAEAGERPEPPEGAEAGEHPEPPEGAEAGERPELPEGTEAGEHQEPPEGAEAGEAPEQSEETESGDHSESPAEAAQSVFSISPGHCIFSQITAAEQ